MADINDFFSKSDHQADSARSQKDNLYFEILKSISGVFDYINLLDFDKKIAERFDLKNNKIENLNLESDPHTIINKEIISGVADEDKEKFWDFTNLTTLDARLKGNKDITADFEYSGKYWFRAQYIRIGEDINAPISLVVYGIKDITSDKIRELEAQEESRKQFKALKSMASVFYSMHVVDLLNNTVIEYDAKNEVKALSSEVQAADEMMRYVMSEVATAEYREEAIEFTDLCTIPDRMKDRKVLSRELIGKRLGWFTASFITVEKDSEERPTKVLFVTRSIDESKKREERLIKNSNTDELTGLLNRRAYEEAIRRIEADGIREDFTYISIDINGLKEVNDGIGHDAGDELIVGACDCLRQCIGPYGHIYRTGGDEFIALIHVSKEQLDLIIRDLEETTNDWSGDKCEYLAVSVGTVTRREVMTASMHEIAVLADKRMYKAKAEYYSRRGIDRRGQKEAYNVICSLYTKILKVNITKDTYKILNIDDSENAEDYLNYGTLSNWLNDFVANGMVHPDDVDEFNSKMNLEFMRDYFKNSNSSLNVLYKRKYGGSFKNTIMKVVPSANYKDDDQNLFLYVEQIEK
ncbi:MAG: GGDEF domain-containing protein [Clostridia bacterium]|nr:GGDEF domain-containing protein [Clostridia bacterium]